MIATELSLLALEIQQESGLDIDTAWKLAHELLPSLLVDVQADTRYRPARVVMFDAKTLWSFTGGDNGH